MGGNWIKNRTFARDLWKNPPDSEKRTNRDLNRIKSSIVLDLNSFEPN